MGQLMLWDSGLATCTIKAHNAPVTAVQCAPVADISATANALEILSAGLDGYIKLWRASVKNRTCALWLDVYPLVEIFIWRSTGAFVLCALTQLT